MYFTRMFRLLVFMITYMHVFSRIGNC